MDRDTDTEQLLHILWTRITFTIQLNYVINPRMPWHENKSPLEFSLSPAVWPWSASGHSLVVHRKGLNRFHNSAGRETWSFRKNAENNKWFWKNGLLGWMDELTLMMGRPFSYFIYILYTSARRRGLGDQRPNRPFAYDPLKTVRIVVASSPSINSTTNRAGGELQNEKSTFVIIQNYYYYYYLEKGEP